MFEDRLRNKPSNLFKVLFINYVSSFILMSDTDPVYVYTLLTGSYSALYSLLALGM